MIQTKKELVDAVMANKEKILSLGVKRLGLFGSFVRNEQDANSDVDFLVMFRRKDEKLRNLVDLGYFLTDLSGRKVEVVTKRSLSKYFGHRILNETEYLIGLSGN